MRYFSLLLLTITFALTTLTLSNCSADEWRTGTKLERELLIVWVAAHRDDTNVMKDYTLRANQEWADLRNHYDQMPLSIRERQTMRMMDAWMAGLTNAVQYGTPRRVLVHLAQLQQHLRALRPEYGKEHPVDLLYAFDEEWRWVEQVSHDQMMCLLEWHEFGSAFHYADRSYGRYKALPKISADDLLPGLSKQSIAAENAGLALTTALGDFESLLEQADFTPMEAASDQVRAAFIDYLSVAVDYPRGAISES